MNTKDCSRCGLCKPVAEFSKNSASKDGLRAQCRTCISAGGREYWRKIEVQLRRKGYIAENLDAVRRSKREYAARNPDVGRSYLAANADHLKPFRQAAGKRYTERNREKIAAYARAYAERNRSEVTARRRLARSLNRDAILAQERQRRIDNPEIFRAYRARRRAVKLLAYLPFDADLFDLVEIEACDLACRREAATGFEWEVDHIVPLQGRAVCGLHTEHNLAVIPKRENRSKGNRYWPNMP